MIARRELSLKDKTNGGNAYSVRMKRQWTAAKTTGVANIS
jgi:hypothetical protein